MKPGITVLPSRSIILLPDGIFTSVILPTSSIFLPSTITVPFSYIGPVTVIILPLVNANNISLPYYCIYDVQARTNSLKICCCSLNFSAIHSGCHCTPRTNFLPGIVIASTSPSKLLAIETTPSAKVLTAW